MHGNNSPETPYGPAQSAGSTPPHTHKKPHGQRAQSPGSGQPQFAHATGAPARRAHDTSRGRLQPRWAPSWRRLAPPGLRGCSEEHAHAPPKAPALDQGTRNRGSLPTPSGRPPVGECAHARTGHARGGDNSSWIVASPPQARRHPSRALPRAPLGKRAGHLAGTAGGTVRCRSRRRRAPGT